MNKDTPSTKSTGYQLDNTLEIMQKEINLNYDLIIELEHWAKNIFKLMQDADDTRLESISRLRAKIDELNKINRGENNDRCNSGSKHKK